MTPEQKLWQWVRYKLPGHTERIENAIGSGRPDVNVCHNGVELNIELKIVTCKRAILRPAQHLWIVRRLKERGLVAVVGQWQDYIFVWNNEDITNSLETRLGKICLMVRDDMPGAAKSDIERLNPTQKGLIICLK